MSSERSRRVSPRVRLFMSGQQVAVRVGPRFLGVRRTRELWSERNRIGWRVVYLPGGWRAFYRRDTA